MRVRAHAARLAGAALALITVVVTVGGLTPRAIAAEAPEGAREPFEAKLQRLEGGKIRLEELRGAPVLLELWTTWCLPCREQARIVHELGAELVARDVVVLSVNQGEARVVVEEFVEDQPSAATVTLDQRQVIASRLGIGELPALVLLDRDGAVVAVRQGLTSPDGIVALLDELEAEESRPAPSAAGRR